MISLVLVLLAFLASAYFATRKMEGGLIAWVKKMFGGGSKAVTTTAPPPESSAPAA